MGLDQEKDGLEQGDKWLDQEKGPDQVKKGESKKEGVDEGKNKIRGEKTRSG